TAEHKKKLSEAHIGKKVNITWGNKISAAQIGKSKSEEAKKKMSIGHIGLRQSEETKIKRSISLRNAFKNKATSIEKKLYEALKTFKLQFEKQKVIGRFIVDAYIPSVNLIIEADGDYWHSLDRVKKKDKAENAYLLSCGYK